MRKIKEAQERADKLSLLIADPETPQGKVTEAKEERSLLLDKIRRAKEKAIQEKNNVTVYGSDDYSGMTAGKYDFYYGYEVTRCPYKSHKTEDDCYAKNCENREWIFQDAVDGEVVFEATTSELGDVECMDGSGLLTGIGLFLQTL